MARQDFEPVSGQQRHDDDEGGEREEEQGRQKPRAGNNGASSSQRGTDVPLEALVIFACRHVYHQSCLEALQLQTANELAKGRRSYGHESGREKEYICPIDG